MKRFLIILLSILMIVCMCCGCASNIVGSWQSNEGYYNGGDYPATYIGRIVFSSNGTYKEYFTFGNEITEDDLISSGTYSVKDNIIELCDEVENKTVYYEYQDNKIITNDEMVYYKK